MLVPFIVEKIIVGRLISIAENVYDPLSTSQTRRFANLIRDLVSEYPTLNHKSKNTSVRFILNEKIPKKESSLEKILILILKKLIETIINKIKQIIDNDIYLPLYSKQ